MTSKEVDGRDSNNADFFSLFTVELPLLSISSQNERIQATFTETQSTLTSSPSSSSSSTSSLNSRPITTDNTHTKKNEQETKALKANNKEQRALKEMYHHNFIFIVERDLSNLLTHLVNTKFLNTTFTPDHNYMLSWAAAKCSLRCMQCLIGMGADPNHKSKGYNALMRVCCSEQSDDRVCEVAEYLIKAKTDLEAKDPTGCTVLMYCAGIQRPLIRVKTLSLLIKSKAKLNIQDKSGKTALGHAMDQLLHKNEALQLISAGADMDKAFIKEHGEDVLGWAAEEGEIAVVRRLVEAEVRVDSGKTFTPLMYAAIGRHDAVVEYLITKKATVDAKDGAGATALMYAADLKNESSSKKEQALKIVQLLLKAKAKVNLVDNERRTALNYARGEFNLLCKNDKDESRKATDIENALIAVGAEAL